MQVKWCAFCYTHNVGHLEWDVLIKSMVIMRVINVYRSVELCNFRMAVVLVMMSIPWHMMDVGSWSGTRHRVRHIHIPVGNQVSWSLSFSLSVCLFVCVSLCVCVSILLSFCLSFFLPILWWPLTGWTSLTGGKKTQKQNKTSKETQVGCACFPCFRDICSTWILHQT